MSRKKRSLLSRRRLMQLTPAVVATVLSRGTGSFGVALAQPHIEPAMVVSEDEIKAALVLLGLDFGDSELKMMLRNVNNALLDYKALREINVPLDTEPAIHFCPALPGRFPVARPSRFRPTHAALTAFNSVEDLAFLPVTRLAPLLKARKASSTELTKMYLRRLRRYSPALFNVITLTEDLALRQAAAADHEIAAGHYRGPLHGVP